jgi:hypothetical protein
VASGVKQTDVAADVSSHTVATLGELCTKLEPPLLEIAIAPRGLDVPVAGAALLDPVEEIGREEGVDRLLVAVRASTGDDELASFVRAAARAGAVGIICRGERPWSPQILETAEGLGLALLTVQTSVAWGELYELISAALVVDDLESVLQAVDGGRHELSDLPAVVEALAAITGGSVAIEDMHSRVVAFSEAEESDYMRKISILNHRIPDEWHREIEDRGIYAQLRRSDDVIHVRFQDLQPRRVIAIRLGRSMLGSMWLAGEDEALSPEADDALRRAAPLAAVQMMRQRLAVGVERRIRESAAAALLLGGDSSPRALAQLGLPSDGQLVVLVVEVVSRTPSSPAAVGIRLTDLLTVHLQAYQRRAVATTLNKPDPDGRVEEIVGEERVYVLASSRSADDRRTLERIIREYIEHARKTVGVELRGGIGHEVEVGDDLVVARRSAEDCLAFADSPVVAFEQVHDRALLADVNDLVANWRGGASAAFQALVTYDEVHGTDYVATLRCLLDTFGSAPEVARRMHLHVNSARYRARKIAEITGVHLDDDEARLALELTVRARTGTAAEDHAIPASATSPAQP